MVRRDKRQGEMIVQTCYRYCKRAGPDITTRQNYLRVSFLTDKKKQGTGAVCTVECVQQNTMTTTKDVTQLPG